MLLTMAHHDRCIRERVIALAEKGGLYDTTNEISGRSRRVLDFLLKKSISENSAFKG